MLGAWVASYHGEKWRRNTRSRTGSCSFALVLVFPPFSEAFDSPLRKLEVEFCHAIVIALTCIQKAPPDTCPRTDITLMGPISTHRETKG